jgi:hypothetical protein
LLIDLFPSRLSASDNNNNNRPHSTDSNAVNPPNNKRTIFRKSELDYSHFVHSINVIRKILCFQNGRHLFPVKQANRETSLKDLIKSVIQIIFETASFKSPNDLSPSRHAYDLLQDLCAAEATCRVCLCHEEVIEQLIKPLRALMQPNKKVANNCLA